MSKVHILLGGNIGEREKVFEKAISEISSHIGEIIKCSSYYETAAWGIEDQPAFLNQVIIINTTDQPHTVLNKLLDIEKTLGRIRFQKWGERIIDLDILFIDNNIINSDDLKVPHPYIQERRFTLVPLVELSKDYIHPVFKKSLSTLLEECNDPLEVKSI